MPPGTDYSQIGEFRSWGQFGRQVAYGGNKMRVCNTMLDEHLIISAAGTKMGIAEVEARASL
jgi:hypothetical protein